MGEEIDFEDGPKRPNFRLSRAPDLDLGSGHGHYLFHLSSSTTVCHISSKSNKLFVDGRTDGKLSPILLGRLLKFGSRPNKLASPMSLESCNTDTKN